MTSYSPGAVVLVRFPFTQLHAAKKRPAVVLSPAQYALRYGDLVVLALTSVPQPESFLSLERRHAPGLLGPTRIKPSLFTLAASIIAQQIGVLQSDDAFRISQALGLILDRRYLRGVRL